MAGPLSYLIATPCIGLPMLFAGQAQKEVTVNEALVAIDFLLGGAVEGVVSTPPAAPAAGKAWIVSTTATGAFADHSDEIAGWTEGGWRFIRPSQGMQFYDRGVGARRYYSDGWSMVSAPSLPVGGGSIDVEARACITALAAALEQIGIISST